MKTSESPEGYKSTGIEMLKTLLDWSPEGVGTHNFIVIKSDTLETETRELLEHNRYTIIIIDDLSGVEKHTQLQKLFVHAQSYMDQKKVPNFPEGKVAIIINKSAWRQLQEYQQTFDAWKANRPYTTVIDNF